MASWGPTPAAWRILLYHGASRWDAGSGLFFMKWWDCQHWASHILSPRPLVTSRGKLFMQPQKVTAGLCWIWEEGGVLLKTFFFFFSLVPRWPLFILLLIYIMLLLLFPPLHVVSSDWAEQTAFLSWMARDWEHITGCPGLLPKRAQLVL